MKICIDKNITATKEFFHYSVKTKEIQWLSSPENCWSISVPKAEYDMEKLAALSGLSFNPLPCEKYLRMMRSVRSGNLENVQWRNCMSSADFKSFIDGLLAASNKVLEVGCLNYYTKVFKSSIDLLRGLERCKIDSALLRKKIAEETSYSQKSALQTFSPDYESFSKKIVYDQFGSRTGRLTVKSGPKILTLRKDLREIITSRYEGGTIYQLDFISLEARLALILAGKVPAQDVYDQVSKEVLNSAHDRESSKIAALSVLYGIGSLELSKRLNVSKRIAADVSRKISKYFGIRDKVKELILEAEENGKIKNAFGRTLDVKDASPHVLCNNFIQSSAVDVALLGFSQISEHIKRTKKRIHPIFVIHDALLIDAHPDEDVEQIIEHGQKILNFDSLFFLKLT